jgi:hypothetical protein
MPDAHSGDMQRISELVQAAMDAGASLRDLEERAGGAVQFQAFSKVARSQLTQMPRSAEAFEGYARALGVDVRTVVLAFATELGLDVRDNQSPLAAMLPAGTDRLTPGQARAIANLVLEITLGLEKSSEEPQPGLKLAARRPSNWKRY